MREVLGPASELLATVRQIIFARGDGGYSQVSGSSDQPPAPLPVIPDRAPDAEVVLTSVPQAALIFRLMGDYNPLHGDPEVAARAGFARPILHGLSTYGMATARLAAMTRHASSDWRCDFPRPFSPARPSDSRCGVRGHADCTFARVDERGVTVLNNGWFELT